jgi:hypothetical protein
MHTTLHRVARIGGTDIVIVASQSLLCHTSSPSTVIIDGTGIVVTAFSGKRLVHALAWFDAAIGRTRIAVVAIKGKARLTFTVYALVI